MDQFWIYYDRYVLFSAEYPQWTALIWSVALLFMLLVVLSVIRTVCTRMISVMAVSKYVQDGLRYREWQILAPEAIKARLESLLWLVQAVLRLVLMVGYLILVMSWFPQTVNVATSMGTWLGERLLEVGTGMLLYLPKLVFILIVVFLTIQVIKLQKAFMLQIEEEKLAFKMFPPEYAAPTRQITTFAIIVFAMVLAAPYLPGAGSQAFQAVTLFIGVLVSLGSSTAVANLIASFVLQYMRAFKVGDTVEIGGHVGKVIQVELFSTRLRTVSNEMVAIPNSVVLTSSMKNFSRSTPLAISAGLSIGYDVPGPRVHEALLKAARALAGAGDGKGLLDTPEPFVLQQSLDDYYVSYRVYAYTDDASALPRLQSALNQSIRSVFEAEDIEILSPAFTELRGKLAS